jgi:signal peptidase I
LAFIFIKFIFLPLLALIFGTSLPLAIVESSSMDHSAVKNSINQYELCGNYFSSGKSFKFEEYWNTCGKWYEDNTNITKTQFSDFRFKNGFKKGDIMIIFGKKNLKRGDVVVFNAGRNHPVIHRVINLNPIQTKGDHNSGQITPANDPYYGTDETNITPSQIIGVAVFRVPYLGWIKLFFFELFQKIF